MNLAFPASTVFDEETFAYRRHEDLVLKNKQPEKLPIPKCLPASFDNYQTLAG